MIISYIKKVTKFTNYNYKIYNIFMSKKYARFKLNNKHKFL